ncbi:MAG: hypothetical protein WA324_19150 [Bryobacteraceae bacterium]
MITADKNIQYQQNIESRKMALVVLSNNERDVVMLNAGKIVAAINNAKPGSFVAVEIF